MRNTFILILLLCVFSFTSISAQEKLLTTPEAEVLLKKATEKYEREKAAFDALSSREDKEKARKNLRSAGWEVGKYRIELFKSRKRDFIRQQANLSEEDANRFFPVYEELQDTIFRLNDKVQRATKRILRSKEKISDADYLAITKQRIDADATKAQIQAQYYEEFKKILSPKKLLLMYDADSRFSHEMIRRQEQRKPQASSPSHTHKK